MIPSHGVVAVYETPNGAFSLREYPIRAPGDDEVLVKIRLSTICRSDIHSYEGKRPNPCPGVLGHEIIGTVIALGKNITHDMRGDSLSVGDRITWSEYFVESGQYMAEVLDLPQKSPVLEKYGHMSADQSPHHHGGFAQYCYVLAKSWILKIPDALSDEEATPINCGVATMMAVVEACHIEFGDVVLIQGLGLLGLYGAAIAKSRGAKLVIGIDAVQTRREQSIEFGVDLTFTPEQLNDAFVLQTIGNVTQGRGVDAVMEVCGVPQAVADGVRCLRTGGIYVIGGLVSPGADVSVDGNLILKKMLTIRGIHNYHPRHLVQALDFVVANRSRFPFKSLVDAIYPLSRVFQAMHDASARRTLRAAISPFITDPQ